MIDLVGSRHGATVGRFGLDLSNQLPRASLLVGDVASAPLIDV
jgi:hypothetical protein